MPLKHFVYIIQENITFDHYFGTFPGANGIPKGAKFAYQPGQATTETPFHLHQTAIPHDLNHSWQAAHVAANGGKMDGFLWAEWPQALAYYWKGTLPALDPEDIVPVMVFDDGTQTYFSFPNNRPIPTVFQIAPDGSEEMVNARMDPDDLLVADRVGRRFILRLGDSVAAIINEAFDLDGVPPRDGTTVPGVARVVKAATPTRVTP